MVTSFPLADGGRSPRSGSASTRSTTPRRRPPSAWRSTPGTATSTRPRCTATKRRREGDPCLPAGPRRRLRDHQGVERPPGARRDPAGVRREPRAARTRPPSTCTSSTGRRRRTAGTSRRGGRSSSCASRGRARSVGVSNFQVPHLQRVVDEKGRGCGRQPGRAPPVAAAARADRVPRGARTSGPRRGRRSDVGRLVDDPVLTRIADAHGVSVAQVLVRWNVQQGVVVLPKSVTPSRIRANIDVGRVRDDRRGPDRDRRFGTDSGPGRTRLGVLTPSPSPSPSPSRGSRACLLNGGSRRLTALSTTAERWTIARSSYLVAGLAIA